MKNAELVRSREQRLSDALDRYAVFRVVLSKRGLRFYSEPIDRRKVESMLRNEPSGMVDIEGLSKTSFEPDQWETIAI